MVFNSGKDLHEKRSPGKTCLTALSVDYGTLDKRINDSKGCGGVKRIAPGGSLFFY